MLAAGLVDELYLTLCPLVFGGTTAPTAFGGIGFSATDVPGFELLDVRRGEDSRLFLHYQRAPREARRKAAL
jgi:5-amino-6-(5-phosphoribosylamino)uracil reductase